MGKLENYNGSVQLIAGITQKGGGDFALIEAHSVQVDENGGRLDEALENKQDKLTPGDNITISKDGVISATGGDASGKLDELQGNNLLYATDKNGEQTALSYDDGWESYGQVPVRDTETGEISVPETPLSDRSAASKKYVDDLVAENSGSANVIISNTEPENASVGTIWLNTSISTIGYAKGVGF